MLAQGEQRPLLVVDDLHWVDAPSLLFLAQLAARGDEAPGARQTRSVSAVAHPQVEDEPERLWASRSRSRSSMRRILPVSVLGSESTNSTRRG